MKRWLILLSLPLLLWGCAGIAVVEDYDTAADLQNLKTYDWRSGANEGPKNGPAYDPFLNERVRSSVEAVLAGAGYKKISSGRADYFVDYVYYVTKEVGSGNGASATVGLGTSFSGGFGGIGIGFARGERSTESQTLSIDIIDPASGKLLWRGTAWQELVRRSDPGKSSRDIRRMVEAILSKFPPKRKTR